MAYGKPFARKSTTSSYRRSRFGTRSSTARPYRTPAAGSYTRSVKARLNKKEIKYDDDYFSLNSWTKHGGTATANTGAYVNYVLGGTISTAPEPIGEDGVYSSTYVDSSGERRTGVQNLVATLAPNCLTNVNNGTTASTRIGNVIQPRYLTIRGVVTASTVNSAYDPETLGKVVTVENVPTQIARYVRTSVRLMIIRDKSMNTKGFVEFTDVFQPVAGEGATGSGNNPYLWNRNLDTIGRYEILKTTDIQLDADDPQQSFSWVIPCRGIPIRYNGSSGMQYTRAVVARGYGLETAGTAWDGSGGTGYTKNVLSNSAELQSMTNGLYILGVSHSAAVVPGDSGISSPSIMFSSRLSFED